MANKYLKKAGGGGGAQLQCFIPLKERGGAPPDGVQELLWINYIDLCCACGTIFFFFL